MENSNPVNQARRNNTGKGFTFGGSGRIRGVLKVLQLRYTFTSVSILLVFLKSLPPKRNIMVFVPRVIQRHFKASVAFDSAEAGSESYAVSIMSNLIHITMAGPSQSDVLSTAPHRSFTVIV